VFWVPVSCLLACSLGSTFFLNDFTTQKLVFYTCTTARTCNIGASYTYITTAVRTSNTNTQHRTKRKAGKSPNALCLGYMRNRGVGEIAAISRRSTVGNKAPLCAQGNVSRNIQMHGRMSIYNQLTVKLSKFPRNESPLWKRIVV
jgi:hypothetical protein